VPGIIRDQRLDRLVLDHGLHVDVLEQELDVVPAAEGMQLGGEIRKLPRIFDVVEAGHLRQTTDVRGVPEGAAALPQPVRGIEAVLPQVVVARLVERDVQSVKLAVPGIDRRRLCPTMGVPDVAEEVPRQLLAEHGPVLPGAEQVELPAPVEEVALVEADLHARLRARAGGLSAVLEADVQVGGPSGHEDGVHPPDPAAALEVPPPEHVVDSEVFVLLRTPVDHVIARVAGRVSLPREEPGRTAGGPGLNAETDDGQIRRRGQLSSVDAVPGGEVRRPAIVAEGERLLAGALLVEDVDPLHILSLDSGPQDHRVLRVGLAGRSLQKRDQRRNHGGSYRVRGAGREVDLGAAP